MNLENIIIICIISLITILILLVLIAIIKKKRIKLDYEVKSYIDHSVKLDKEQYDNLIKMKIKSNETLGMIQNNTKSNIDKIFFKNFFVMFTLCFIMFLLMCQIFDIFNVIGINKIDYFIKFLYNVVCSPIFISIIIPISIMFGIYKSRKA